MRIWHTLGSLLLLSACGGVVGDPVTDGTRSGVDNGTAEENPAPAPATPTPTTPSNPTTPTTPPPVTGNIFANATGIEVKGGTLGAAPGTENTRSYRFDPTPTTVLATYKNGTETFTLTAAEQQALSAKLALVVEVPMQTPCAMDGPAASIVVSRSGVQNEYFGQDYNCHHRTDVLYADGVQALIAQLDQIAAAH